MDRHSKVLLAPSPPPLSRLIRTPQPEPTKSSTNPHHIYSPAIAQQREASDEPTNGTGKRKRDIEIAQPPSPQSSSLHLQLTAAPDAPKMESTSMTPIESGPFEGPVEPGDVDGDELDEQSESLFKEVNQDLENDELESTHSDVDLQRPIQQRTLNEVNEEEDDDDNDDDETTEFKYALHSPSFHYLHMLPFSCANLPSRNFLYIQLKSDSVRIQQSYTIPYVERSDDTSLTSQSNISISALFF
jgi:hypothetical protein